MPEKDITELQRELDEANKKAEEQARELEKLTGAQADTAETVDQYEPLTAPQMGAARFDDVPAAGTPRGATGADMARAQGGLLPPTDPAAHQRAIEQQQRMVEPIREAPMVEQPTWGGAPDRPAWLQDAIGQRSPAAAPQVQQPGQPPGPGQLAAQMAAMRRMRQGY